MAEHRTWQSLATYFMFPKVRSGWVRELRPSLFNREDALSLPVGLRLRGGYNCTTWTRANGYPSAFGNRDINESRIENRAPDQSIAAVRISDATDVLVEGFTIAATTGLDATTIGLRVKWHQDGACRNLLNDVSRSRISGQSAR
jgi:hypothetical protein